MSIGTMRRDRRGLSARCKTDCNFFDFQHWYNKNVKDKIYGSYDPNKICLVPKYSMI